MIFSYFNNTKPINLLFLSIFLNILIVFRFFIHEDVIFSIPSILKILLFLVSFFVYNFITSRKLLSAEKDFGILFYTLLSGIFYMSFINLNKITANLLILFALIQIYDLGNKITNERKKIFNNGLLIGTATLFYPLSALFILVSYAAIIIFKKLNLRILLIPIIGFFIPFFIVFVLNDIFAITWLDKISLNYLFALPYFFNSTILQLTSIVLILVLIGSLFKISFNINSELIYYKKYHILILIQLIIAVVILLFSPIKDGSEMIFLIFPISILLANSFPLINKKWLGNGIIILLFALLILNYNF